MHTNVTTIARLAIAITLTALFAFTSGCSDVEAESLETSQFGLMSRLQNLEDSAAIRDVMDCYGHGHDLIFFDLEGDRAEAIDVLRECFAEDVQTDVYFFGADKPAAQLASLQELVGFVAQFAIDSGYASARNIPGNHRIEFTGPTTARMLSSTHAPHFLRAPADAESPGHVDIVSARYENEVALDDDDRWRTTRFVLRIEGFWRGTGINPLGQ